MLFGSSLIEQVLMAALVGLMFMVAIGTFEWSSLKIFRKVPAIDVFVMIIVAGITVVFHNLAVAVIAGVVISALGYAWEVEKIIHLRHLSADCRALLDNASAIIDVNHYEDSHYKLVSDMLG